MKKQSLALRSKKAGRFEKLLGFARSHSIVTRGSVSLSCATTPHSSCFSKSQRYKKRKVFTLLKSPNSAHQISTLVILVKFPTRLFPGASLKFLRMNFELFWFLYKNWTEKAKKVGQGRSSRPTAEDVKTEQNFRYFKYNNIYNYNLYTLNKLEKSDQQFSFFFQKMF